MKRARIRNRTLFFGLALLFLCRSGQAADLSIKISGGFRYGLFGDINSGLKGYLDICRDFGTYLGGTIIDKTGPLHFGADYSVDFLLNLGSSYSVGLGVGRVCMSRRSELTTLWPDERPESTAIVEAAVEAVPVTISLSKYFPLHRGLSAYFAGGLEVYPARFQSSYWPAGPGNSDHQKARSLGLGVFYGAGLEIKAFSRVAVFFEARGNYARIGGFKGTRRSAGSTLPYEEQGALYYYKVTINTTPGMPKQYPFLMIHETEPSEEVYGPVRSARVDFSGFALLGGIKIYF